MPGVRRRKDPSGRLVLASPPGAPVRYPRAVVTQIDQGELIRRLYWPARYGATADGFRYVGPVSRFDHQRRPSPFPAIAEDPDRGILYAARLLRCCVAECFGDAGSIEPKGARLAVLQLTEPLKLLDIRGAAAMKVGTIAAINQDGDRELTQDWARHWYAHPDLQHVDGLMYAGAHTSDDAVAVWERANGKFDVVVDLALDDPRVIGELTVIAEDLELPVL